MRSFKIAFEGDEQDDGKQIEFVAHDLGHAFFVLEREATNKVATLMEGDKQLGMLKRSPTGYWQLLA